MHGIGVVAATIHSDAHGTGLEQFRVERSFDGDVPWAAVVTDLTRMLDGELDLPTEVARRERMYPRRARQGAVPVRTSVHVDNDISATATVIDVHASDGVGVLYRITDVLARHGLDIRSAKVQTMGAEVVDAFYVRGATGSKVTGESELAAIRQDVLAALVSSE
jgi:[protein-PII] uridylyltransferase